MERAERQVFRISASSGHALAGAILENYGVSPENSNLVADSLTRADLRGVDTHGINRLAGYIARVEAGLINPNPSLEFEQRTPVIASLDAKNTFGFVAGCLSVDHCIEMAKVYGMGMVAVKRSNHFGMGATYVLRAVEQGFACFRLSMLAVQCLPGEALKLFW